MDYKSDLPHNPNTGLDVHAQLEDDAVTPTNFSLFEIGSKFFSYSEFEKAKELYERKYFAVLVKAKSEKYPEGHEYSEKLIFKNIIYECKRGRKRKPSVSKGIRPNVKTGKLGCNFMLKLSAIGGVLVMKECCLEHSNHELNEENYIYLPEKLRLNAEEMKDAEICIKSGVKKKNIQAYLMQQRGGKPVLLKTLYNISTKLQQNQTESKQSDLEMMLDSMRTIPDTITNVACEKDTKQLLGVYFQDVRMQAAFQKFPELVIFDATYLLNNYKLPLFVLLAINGSGETEVIALFIFEDVSKVCIGTMLDFFKENNEAWEYVEVMVGDKDFADRKVLEEKFPMAEIQICQFHALQTFKREIPIILSKISIALKKQILQIFSDLAYSESKKAYDINYRKLVSLNMKELTSYFNKKWHLIKDEWVLYEQNRNFIVNNKTTNRLKDLNQKIKNIISRYSVLGYFFQDLIVSAVSRNVEQDHRALTMVEKVPVQISSLNEVQKEIKKNLTAFAAKHVIAEYKQSSNVSFSTIDNGSYFLKEEGLIVKATDSTCTCSFKLSMGLPCRHIMAVREKKNLPIYENSLSRARWTQSYHQSAHPAFKEGDIGLQCKSECEKYSEVKKITNNINSLLSMLPEDKFSYYLSQLKEFEKLLSSEKPKNVYEHKGPENETSEHQPYNLFPIVGPDELQTIDQQFHNPAPIIMPTNVQQPPGSAKLALTKLKTPVKKQRNSKGCGQTVTEVNRGRKRKRP